MPTADVGDTIPGQTVGVVDYSFSNYKLELTSAPKLASGGLQREVTERQGHNQLAVATFNVENLDPGDPQTKFDRLAGQIVTNLRAPDILALEEIQDNSGATNDGTVDSSETVAMLTPRSATPAVRRTYARGSTRPTAPTAASRAATSARSSCSARPRRSPSSTARAAPRRAHRRLHAGAPAHLTASPGRINPTKPPWASSASRWWASSPSEGATVFVIANHFASKGGDDPLFGRFQQPVRASEVQRDQQADEVRAFVDHAPDADASAKVVVLGDLNDFEFSPTVDTLVGAQQAPARRMVDLPRTLPASQRYSYVYEGNSQVLDHILVSPALTTAQHGPKRPAYEYDIVHTNAEFHDQDCDHDPQVVRLAIRPGKG